MLASMTERISVTMDDRLAALVRDAAERQSGGNVSDWLSRAARRALLADDARALAAHATAHPGEHAEQLAEAETERDARWRAEQQGRGAA